MRFYMVTSTPVVGSCKRGFCHPVSYASEGLRSYGNVSRSRQQKTTPPACPTTYSLRGANINSISSYTDVPLIPTTMMDSIAVLRDERSFYTHWCKIVESYMACNLSVPHDKPPAISSIAKVMASLINDEYIAEMWRLYLMHDMLWWKLRLDEPENIHDYRVSREFFTWSCWICSRMNFRKLGRASSSYLT